VTVSDPFPAGPATEVQQGVGDPDGFARLWTPHRMAYIEKGSSGQRERDDCPFCRLPDLPDAQSLIVARGTVCFAVLNLYPYNPGHLLIVPYRHIADYTDLTDAESLEFAGLTRQALRALRTASRPGGFNVGMNLGAMAGAGIAEHLHQHVVPRWGGDMNFMPVVGHTRVLAQLLTETRQRVADAWPVDDA
jgi:ATP adenylyltransferase